MGRAAQGIRWLGLVFLAATAAAQSAPQATQAPKQHPADAAELVRRAESALRGDTTTLAVRMTIDPSGLSVSRVVAFHVWDDRLRDRAFLRVLSPSKEAGTSFLRLPPNVWSYVPRLETIARVPTARLREPWLRSDFTLDDWLQASGDLEDYDAVWLRTEQDADGREGVTAHVVELRPREGRSVAWGRIESWIEAERALLLRRDYYDREGAAVRTLRFRDFREVEGRPVPWRWVMTPAGDPGRETRVELESIDFDPVLDDSIFATRHLREGAGG